MADQVTALQVKASRLKLTMALDGDFYTNHFQSVAFPELTKVTSGPKQRGHMGHTRKYYVGDIEVPADPQAIVDAINAMRAKPV
jgi:uncharacterized protein YdbL (DUF1318 family)